MENGRRHRAEKWQEALIRGEFGVVTMLLWDLITQKQETIEHESMRKQPEKEFISRSVYGLLVAPG